MTSFEDHFSRQAADYARFRPNYPAALFEFLAELTPDRRRAWDCATGSGQAALGLAGYFGAAGKGQPEEPANLIEGLAGGVIPCATKPLVLTVRFHEYEVGMAS